MMKRLLNSAAIGVICGIVMSAAFALTISGRDSANRNAIWQNGISALSTELGITATASGTQATSYQLSAGFSLVTTVATIGDGVRLPSITNIGAPSNVDASLNVIVVNDTANAMNVFPFLATDIIVSNGAVGGAGGALSVTARKQIDCWSATSTGRWYCTQG